MQLREAVILSNIAEGRMDKTRVREAAMAVYRGARTRYIDTSQQLVALLGTHGDLRVNLNHDEAALKGIEAGWVRDGELDGLRNDRERDAKLECLRAEDEGYLAIVQRIEETKRALLASVEPDIERLKLELRLCRLDIEVVISELRVVAGEEEYTHGN